MWYIFLFATSLMCLVNYNKEQKCDNLKQLYVVVITKLIFLVLVSYSLDKIIENIIKSIQ